MNVFCNISEFIFRHFAKRAVEIFGKILKLGAGSDADVGVAQSFFVNVAANAADVFLHNHVSSLTFAIPVQDTFRQARRNIFVTGMPLVVLYQHFI
mgnify:CR=1 FL=1